MARGVLLLAVAGPAPGRSGGVTAAVSAARGATRHLMGGAPPGLALARGMGFFERSSDVPVAVGAPRRGGFGPPECDAVLLDGDGTWGGVGAVTNLESPVRLAVEVVDRGWGLLVGAGVEALAKELGMVALPWATPTLPEAAVVAARPTARQEGAANPAEAALDAGLDASDHANSTRTPGSGGAETGLALAGASPEREGAGLDAGDAGTVDGGPDGATTVPVEMTVGGIDAPVTVAPPVLAAILLRDEGGRFFVVAEACGAEGAPPGQVTKLLEPGTSVFVDGHGAVVVATDEPAPRAARLAERIHRRLGIVQMPQIAADWGLQQTERDTVVAIVSRLGSAIAARPASTWARNGAEGESSSADSNEDGTRTAAKSGAMAPRVAVPAPSPPTRAAAAPGTAPGQATAVSPASPPSATRPGRAAKQPTDTEPLPLPGAAPAVAAWDTTAAAVPVASATSPGARPRQPADQARRRANQRNPTTATGGSP